MIRWNVPLVIFSTNGDLLSESTIQSIILDKNNNNTFKKKKHALININ